MAEARNLCIGFGDKEGCCDTPITDAALALNSSGLWCRSCEEKRRAHIDRRFAQILAATPTQHEETP
ncbi:MAG TPA: hypothetical protein VD761_11895 [Solirubrobacterales bacterium]|nr:hypothetical protein [Solirubrobacterales bacterium]